MPEAVILSEIDRSQYFGIDHRISAVVEIYPLKIFPFGSAAGAVPVPYTQEPVVCFYREIA